MNIKKKKKYEVYTIYTYTFTACSININFECGLQVEKSWTHIKQSIDNYKKRLCQRSRLYI